MKSAPWFLAGTVVVCTLSSAMGADVVVCPLEEAVRRMEDYNIQSRAERAIKLVPIVKEMGEINAKAKNPILPLGAQLSKVDRERFQQLRFQILLPQSEEIEYSSYLRDSRVILQLSKVANDIFRQHEFTEHDPQFFYYSTVALLTLQQPEKIELTT